MSGVTPVQASFGQLRAQSFSVMCSTRTRCNAGCRFCISKITPGTSGDQEEVKTCTMAGIEKGLRFAARLGASHMILTGKADPTQEDDSWLCEVTELCSRNNYLPFIDMHTNGLLLRSGKTKQNLLFNLAKRGLTHITFSIASFLAGDNRNLMQIEQRPEELIPQAVDFELHVRCSLVVNKAGVSDFEDIMEYIRQAGNLGAHAVVIRELWYPEVYSELNKEVFEWNKEYFTPLEPMEKKFQQVAEDSTNQWGIQELDPLPWGTKVFVVGGIFSDTLHGVNVTFARCDEGARCATLKSIVHKPNGHGYRNWGHNGDILY
jgi:molybdenum cofactor biosynthesis enzyme MoaA